MSIIYGKNVVLSCSHNGEYHALGGMRATNMTLEANYARANAVNDSEWEELSSAPTARSLRLGGEAIFYTDNSEQLFAHHVYNGNHVQMQLSLDDTQTIEGKFAVERYNYQSDARSPLTFSVTLKSSGLIVFS